MAKHRRSRAPPSSKPKRKKKPAAAPSIASYHRVRVRDPPSPSIALLAGRHSALQRSCVLIVQGMSERDYTALIPPSELQQLQLIVSEVHAARGWGATRMECTAAWDSLLEQAMSPEGGSWDPHLPAASSLQAERLAQLAGLVDRVLLGGALQGWLRAQGKAEVSVGCSIVVVPAASVCGGGRERWQCCTGGASAHTCRCASSP